jgi:hypothetical protein
VIAIAIRSIEEPRVQDLSDKPQHFIDRDGAFPSRVTRLLTNVVIANESIATYKRVIANAAAIAPTLAAKK